MKIKKSEVDFKFNTNTGVGIAEYNGKAVREEGITDFEKGKKLLLLKLKTLLGVLLLCICPLFLDAQIFNRAILQDDNGREIREGVWKIVIDEESDCIHLFDNVTTSYCEEIEELKKGLFSDVYWVVGGKYIFVRFEDGTIQKVIYKPMIGANITYLKFINE